MNEEIHGCVNWLFGSVCKPESRRMTQGRLVLRGEEAEYDTTGNSIKIFNMLNRRHLPKSQFQFYEQGIK